MRTLLTLIILTPLFALGMSLGESGNDVLLLQQALNKAGYTVTNYGEETTFFGPSTEAALTRYQIDHAHDILKGTGVLNNLGTFDPLTKLHLMGMSGSVLGATTGAAFTTNLSLGMTHPEVKLLQQFLNTKGYTVASQGAGSKGLETAFYGPATMAAVKRYQEANRAAILTPNNLTSGTGLFFTSTRNKANSEGMTLLAAATTGTTLLAATPDGRGGNNTDLRTLTLTLRGSGTVSTSDGQTCSSPSCVFSLANKSRVTLTATPNTGAAFSSWSESCSGTQTTCALTMSRDRSVTATFSTVTPPPPTMYTLTTSVSGSGSVTGSGITCPTDCTETYASGTIVTLTAVPQSGYTFAGWSGACTGTATTCTVSMISARSAGASFAQIPTPINGTCGASNGQTLTSAPTTNLCTAGTASSVTGSGPWYWSCAGSNGGTTAQCSALLGSTNPTPTTYTLTVSRSGTGSGSVSGTGITCGTDCSEAYTSGTNVTLTATPASGSTFTGWSGACTGTATTCTVSMTMARSVGAGFGVVTSGSDPYPLYPSLNLNDAPWHTSSGGWGPQVRLQAPSLPVTTRSVTVNSLAEFNTAAATAGTRITIATGWAGNTTAVINASDIDVVIPAGVTIGAIELGNWPRTTPIARIRIQGDGRMGQFRGLPGTAGIYTDVVIDGIDMNGDSGFGPGAESAPFRVGVTRLAVLNVRAISPGYVWLGNAKHVVIANSNFYHGASTRADSGFAEGWGIRNSGGPMTIIDSRIQGTRYVNVRTQSVGETGELLYIARSTLVATAEGRTAWFWNNLGNGSWFGQGAVIENSDIYTYAAVGCGYGAEISAANVNWSQVRNNRFFGGGTAVFTPTSILSSVVGGGSSAGNTFAALTSFPAWGGPGDPTQIPLPNGLSPITGEGQCPGFTSSTNPTPTTYTLTVSRSGTGSGSVSGTGITCGTDCSEAYTSGTNVTLTATPASGSTFTGWSGACTGTATTCTVSMTMARTVSAGFTLNSTAINGQCGTANGGTFSSVPTTNLCTSGTQSSVTTNTSSYTWSCGGTNGGTTAQCSATRTTTPPPTGGTTYYFSDCQSGAASSCVSGNNANSGTSQNAPKRDLTGMNINTLPAGTNLLFARGGVWNMPLIELNNLNTSAAAPLTIDAYGTGERPVFRTASGNGINFGGRYGNTTNDGGYVVRNIRLDGQGTTEWGMWFVQYVRDVIVENVEIHGYKIGINASRGTAGVVTNITVRNSTIRNNSEMGMLGTMENSLIENNVYRDNNYSGSYFNHGIYGSYMSGTTIRNNTFTNNSVNLATGACEGGNITIHGLLDGLLIEGNRIQNTNAASTCGGVSLTTGYSTPEGFRNSIIRNNTVINTGFFGIAANAAPGVIIENNRVIKTQDLGQNAIAVPSWDVGVDDLTDSNPIVRDNTICHTRTSNVAVRATAPGAVVSNNTHITGSAALTDPRCAF